jgi:hypothetical protein
MTYRPVLSYARQYTANRWPRTVKWCDSWREKSAVGATVTGCCAEGSSPPSRSSSRRWACEGRHRARRSQAGGGGGRAAAAALSTLSVPSSSRLVSPLAAGCGGSARLLDSSWDSSCCSASGGRCE